eukprot:9615396-Alexandrium_andersonii.AAC.1
MGTADGAGDPWRRQHSFPPRLEVCAGVRYGRPLPAALAGLPSPALLPRGCHAQRFQRPDLWQPADGLSSAR